MKVKLGEICGYVKGKTLVSELTDKTYISTENMLPNKMGITLASSLPTSEQTQIYRIKDVLVSNIRPYFKKIWQAEWDGGCSADVLVFRAKEGIFQDYLYFVLSDNRFFEYSMATSKGTKMPRGDKTSIMQYEVELPSYDEQVKIASVLSDIETKIKLNNEINSNLFEQANALFYNYVIVPSNFEKSGTLGDYCDVKSGYAFKSAWWTTSGVKVIKIKTIENDALNLNECSYVSPDKSDYAKDFSVVAGDVLIAMTGATIGKFAIVPYLDEEILVNQRVGRFFLGDNPIEKLPFLYCSLKQNDIIADIINKGQGSAQPNISGNDILTTPCYLPATNEIDEFNQLCKPYFETILRNQRQNIELSNIRDTLLPKLMSGVIDLSNIGI